MDVIIDLIKPFLEDRREDDAFDRLNYKSTPILLFLSALISTAKLYTGGIIECFTKAVSQSFFLLKQKYLSKFELHHSDKFAIKIFFF
jgi:hypothetical protein